jgi:hypothetical protein
LSDESGAGSADTVMGFGAGSNHLTYAGATPADNAQIIASARTVNGNTVLSFPDTSQLTLVGVSHVDASIFA